MAARGSEMTRAITVYELFDLDAPVRWAMVGYVIEWRWHQPRKYPHDLCPPAAV